MKCMKTTRIIEKKIENEIKKFILNTSVRASLSHQIIESKNDQTDSEDMSSKRRRKRNERQQITDSITKRVSHT
jgi:hypothetical protein